MESLEKLKDSLFEKGLPYFEKDELDSFLAEIEKRFDSPLGSFHSLSQEGEIVQLEFSFLTPKAIYDFTLKKSSVETYIFFLKDITYLNEDTTLNGKTLKVSNGGAIVLFYKAFNKNDKVQLDKYIKVIINEINKI